MTDNLTSSPPAGDWAASNDVSGAVAPSSYVTALARMAWDVSSATELGTLLEPSSFPDKVSRDLFNLFASEVPKGASISSLYSMIETHAKHCLPLFREIEAEAGTDAIRDTVTNEYLAERVADEGKRVRLARQANQILADINEGKPTADIISHADMQRAAIDLAAERANSRFLLKDDAEIEAAPQPAWLIDSIFPLGAMAVVIGPPGSFKSFAVLDAACHIQTGLDWCNRKTLVGQVVYLAGEGGSGLNKRMAAWRAQNNYTGRVGIHFLTNPLTLNEPADLAGIIKAIQSKGIAPKLIVVDTLSRFMAGDENTVKDMAAFIRAADELRRKFGCTAVIVHHSGKDTAKGARGSSALQGATDVEIVCERGEGEMSVTLTCSKQKDGAPFRPIILEAVQIAGSLALLSSGPGTARLAGKALDGLLALRDNDTGSGLTHAEWLDVADQGKSTFHKSLKTLKAWAYVRVTRGRYSVNEAGEAAIRSTQSTTGTPLVHSNGQIGPLTRGYIGTPVVDQTSALILDMAVA